MRSHIHVSCQIGKYFVFIIYFFRICYFVGELRKTWLTKNLHKMSRYPALSTAHIDQLPEEVLIIIIIQLQLKDRKNTRLVCRRWLEVNNLREVSKKEKFVCSIFDDVHLILRTIKKSERKILNVDFVGVSFNAGWPFWNACGSRIESLHFKHCSGVDSILPSVIEGCEKMKCLTITKFWTYGDKSSTGNKELVVYIGSETWTSCLGLLELISTTDLKDLKRRTIRREHLKSFKLRTTFRFLLSFDFLKFLLDIYPNLEDFVCLDIRFTRTILAELVQDESTFADKLHQHILSNIRPIRECTFNKLNNTLAVVRI